jgi:iron(III) transport system substrate-binding protein
MRLDRKIMVGWKVSFMLLSVLFCETIFADSPSEEAAKREGKVVWYSVSTESLEVAKHFEKKYPSVKIEVVRATNDRILNRIVTETMAGNYGYDVVRVTGPNLFPLIKRGLLRPYDSPERNAYTTGWKDPKGLWTSTDQVIIVLGYNPLLVSAADVPKTWEDLLNPKWKGKIGVDPEDFVLLPGLESRWGAEKARTFLKGLAGQDVLFRNGHTLLAQLVVAGEMPLAFVYAHRVISLQAKGAPIDMVTTMDPTVSIPGLIGMGANPPHPNAAKLLIDYSLSKEGQQVLQNLDRIPTRSELQSPKLRFPLVPLQPEHGEKMREYQDEFRSLFGVPGARR